ncbi:MAG: hypothetical protein Q8N47_23570, partial [Bryobacterales bacterium]|nr:hypothetical protein [Bryobacterales bacterium]
RVEEVSAGQSAAAGTAPGPRPPSRPYDEVSAAQGAAAGGPAQPAAQMQPMQLEVVALGSTRELDYGMVTDDPPAAASDPPTAKSDTPAAKPVAPAASGSPPGSTPRPARPRAAAFGFVEFDGQGDDTTVLVNGKPMSGQTAGKLQLPAGSYEIRMVRGGTIVDRQKVEVRPSSTTRIVVKR